MDNETVEPVELKEKLWKLYKLRDKLIKGYTEGRISREKYNRTNSAIKDRIKVYGGRLRENIQQEQRELYRHLTELNKKHEGNKVNEELYKSAHVKLDQKIRKIEHLLRDIEDDKGLYNFIKREKHAQHINEGKNKHKIATIGQIIVFLAFLAFIYWFIQGLMGVFYVDQQAVIQELNLSTDGIIEYEGDLWRLTFESEKKSVYEGKVRHISRNNEKGAPMMTHDILVTTGDYADEDKVQTIVKNHKFTWRSKTRKLSGNINLIHGIPANTSIYAEIEKIKSGNSVVIEGYEIQRIINLQNNGFWEDDGCNTLYITSVEIKE